MDSIRGNLPLCRVLGNVNFAGAYHSVNATLAFLLWAMRSRRMEKVAFGTSSFEMAMAGQSPTCREQLQAAGIHPSTIVVEGPSPI